MTSVYCVGLTGNIASGKSTVASLFSALGISVLSADVISKQLTMKNGLAYSAMLQHYGVSLLQTDGEFNRQRLRKLIFNDPIEKKWLEQLLHPLIRRELTAQVNNCTSPYCIVEIPLHINKEHYPYLNRILLIISPTVQQMSRLIQRDQCDQSIARAIIAQQPSIEERLKTADDVLMNDEDQDKLADKVYRLHKQYTSNAKKNI